MRGMRQQRRVAAHGKAEAREGMGEAFAQSLGVAGEDGDIAGGNRRAIRQFPGPQQRAHLAGNEFHLVRRGGAGEKRDAVIHRRRLPSVAE